MTMIRDCLQSPDNYLARVRIEAVCHDCRHRHRIEVVPDHFGQAAFDWEVKHRGHRFEFLTPSRFIPRGFDDRIFEEAGQAPWWLDYKHNADIKLAYAADAQITITLASLGSSSTFVAGREGTAISNASSKYLDVEVTGVITTNGASAPTADTEIRLYGIKPINDTPTWPGGFGGTDSSGDPVNAQVVATLPLIWSTRISSSTGVAYPIISGLTLAQLWGFVPDNWTPYVTHNTGQVLHATGSNHEISYRGVYATSI